jgi:CRISPR/Cas system-associated endoribonuclease Cas2
MAVSLRALRDVFRGELTEQQLADLKAIYESFVEANQAEREAAEAIAQNVNDALRSFIEGRVSKSDLLFILQHAQNGYRALMDARILRIKKSAFQALFKAINRWVFELIPWG